ncbi:MAG: hypothetical protein HZB68_02085 [Candidatus Aenigmarchaeota archaeon]|nr:hypothetical protein [Candidatus Aenigmarchaeota archaeon]
MRIALFLLLLLPLAFAQQALVPVLKASVGDTLIINMPFYNDTTGKLMAGFDAEVVISETKIVKLYDDGNHSDVDVQDGVYGNKYVVDVQPGTYVIRFLLKDGEKILKTSNQSWEISPKPLVPPEMLPYVVIGSMGAFVAVFFIYKRARRGADINARINELECRKEAINKALEDAQRDFFTRKIDENTLTEMTTNYKKELANIDVELQKIWAKKKNPS